MRGYMHPRSVRIDYSFVCAGRMSEPLASDTYTYTLTYLSA